ncbi:Protein kinase protein rad53 [Exophiala dermatitidis]|nr:Protein kinase protein rad53 [Exophiala dermatitidis]KAJ4559493.1 Protein kinase protein rad53 [Exophiala dermatitidis]KAJ4656423.1 Protein kinase protein rad53 [Exophiala dermatitidis]KAJ4686834.1 Protein kinase protein rad53 [Exophiala dermatitidis]
MDLADRDEDADCGLGNGCLQSSDSGKTALTPEGYYDSRLGDLAPFVPRSVLVEEDLARSLYINANESWETVETVIMDESSQPTQPATQPVDNPRRFKNLSNVSEADAADVICLLHPTSPAAFKAIKANLLFARTHILQNEGLEGLSEEAVLMTEDFEQPRDIALRISSPVKNPKDGFRFGRTSALSDVLLTPYENDSLVSKVHFRIFVNRQGSLMLQDMSTNGTIVDDTHICHRNRRGQTTLKPATIVLRHGSIIAVVSGCERQEVKLMVRIPARGDMEEAYDQNLKKYLAARGEIAQFSSMRESSYGNHWNGGSLYNFTGMLGKGAFATVYRVQTKKEGDLYAAKELDKRRFIKNGVLDMKFDSELNIMKHLKHPNIVNYVDCQTYSHWIYILMEFVPHGELSQELRRLGKIPESDAQQITKQILHALDYLHRRNITHRDIKPDNILIASRSPLIVKLSDFGLSKCVTDQETFLKTFCGTLLYCAPEVYPDYPTYAQGSTTKRRRLGEPMTRPKPSPYDQSVDMWSFGAVIFHMLCGKPPITGRGDDRGAQMLNNIMTKDVDFEPLRYIGVSEEAIDFISGLLNRNPALRPKEAECLRHPWLRDVPDNCNYDDVEPVSSPVARHLDMVDEADEDVLDDEELIHNLNQLTQPPSSNPTPDRPTKRPRTEVENIEPAPSSGDVHYPTLPESGESFLPLPTGAPAQRLFGEISQSVLRSSGVFGGELAAPACADVYDIRNRVEQISVNDFASVQQPEEESADNSGQPLHYPRVLDVPQGPAGSAESLLGAEQQIGQLNMASPEPDVSDAATPETGNPVTPQTREISPSETSTRDNDADTEVAATTRVSEEREREPVFTRQIDFGLISDPAQFEVEVEKRNASRAAKMAKAETFHGTLNGNKARVPSVELAVTIDARTGHEVPHEHSTTDQFTHGTLRSLSGAGTSISPFVRPPRRFGKLTSLPGSYTNVTINLEQRLTSWGRGVDCTIQHPDVKDTRIPKYAMKITFWAPGMESHVEQGGDWTTLPAIRTVLSTSASGCIWINGRALRKESRNGEAALFGKLYTGDIITIYDDGKGKYLKFRVEITFGDSARQRPKTEPAFVVQEERYHHRRMKERESMRISKTESGAEATVAAAASAASPAAVSAGVAAVPTVRVEAE